MAHRGLLVGAVLSFLGVGCWAAGSTLTEPASAPVTASLALTVNPKKVAALVGDRFLGLTMDPVDLSKHRNLGPGAVRSLAMARGLAPAYLRLAGPSSDGLRFGRGDQASGNGTISESDVRATALWARAAGWRLVLGLNVLQRAADGSWDGRNAADLLALADQEDFPIGLQLGYESGGLERDGVDGATLGKDLVRARSLLSQFPRFRDALLLGPDVVVNPASKTGRAGVHYLQDETRVADPDAVVWQPWPADSEGSNDADAADPTVIEREEVSRLLGRAATRRSLWIAESDSDAPWTFGNGALRWAARVQAAARIGADVILRRWREAGDDHRPTPDFWVSLLHRRLCGRAVLDSRLAGGSAADLGVSITAQCTLAGGPESQNGPSAHILGGLAKLTYERGDVTLFAVNRGKTKTKLAVKLSSASGLHQAVVHEYILTAPGHDLGSRSALLNGEPLSLEQGGALPGLKPKVRRSSSEREMTLELPPFSVAFFVFPGAHARACESAPSSPVEAVPVQLGTPAHDVHVQFHVEGFGKSKVKDKLAASSSKKAEKEAAAYRSQVVHDNLPLSLFPPTSMEQYADMDESTPRSKRAALAAEDTLSLRPSPRTPHAKHRPAPPRALSALPAQAVPVPADEPSEGLSTIPAAHIPRPDEITPLDSRRAPYRLPPLRPLRLPKRVPLLPAPLPHAPRHAAPSQRPAPPVAPAPRLKHLPRGGAVVASLVDPQRGVSAEDTAEEDEDAVGDNNFPSGDVLAAVGESDEDHADSRSEEAHDYLDDEEDDVDDEEEEKITKKKLEEGKLGDRQQPGAGGTPEAQFYFPPGEFMAALQQRAAGVVDSRKPFPTDGEIGEMDMMAEPVNVVDRSTPSPFEPHFENFVSMQAPTLAHQSKPLADLEGSYQGATEESDKPEHAVLDKGEDLDTDMLVELGKKYLREKKMAVHLDDTNCEKSWTQAQEEQEHKVRRRRQAVRSALPTGASTKPLPVQTFRSRNNASPRQSPLFGEEAPRRKQSPPFGEDASRRNLARDSDEFESGRLQSRDLRDLRQQLERVKERLEEQLEQVRGQQRGSMSQERGQLEQQRQQRMRQREQTERELREQVERRQRERGRATASTARTASARPQLLPQLRTARLKRSSSAEDAYFDSFARRGAAWASGRQPISDHHRDSQHHHVHHVHHGDDDFTLSGASGRFRYGHSPQRVRQDVRNEVVKKTNVVRYLPVEEEDGTMDGKVSYRQSSDRPVPSALHHRKNSRRSQNQAYKPNDNVAAVWGNSPLSPIRPVIVHGHRLRGDLQDSEDSSESVHVESRPGLTENYDDELLGPVSEEPPTEVKTTHIVKTERTYETTAPNVPVSREDSGYESSGETGGDLYASLGNAGPPGGYEDGQDATAGQSVSTSAEESDSRRTRPHVSSARFAADGRRSYLSSLAHGTSREKAKDAGKMVVGQSPGLLEPKAKHAKQVYLVPLLPPEAEGEEGPMPEFPFKEPPGPKTQVIGFKADDYSPGGWFTFLPNKEVQPAPSSSFPTARWALSPVQQVTNTRPPQGRTVVLDTVIPQETQAPPQITPSPLWAPVRPQAALSAARPERVRVVPFVSVQDAPSYVQQILGRPTARKQPAPSAPSSPAFLSQLFQPVNEQGLSVVSPVGGERRQVRIQSPGAQMVGLWNQPAPVDDVWGQPSLPDNLWAQPRSQPSRSDNLWAQPNRQPSRSDNLWAQPSSQSSRSDNLWAQPSSQSSRSDNLWAQPNSQSSRSDNLWAQPNRQPSISDNLWAQPSSSWKQPSRSDDLWAQPVPSGNSWAHPVNPVPRQAQRQSTQVASLDSNTGEQLLDYNTHILKTNPNAQAPKAPALQFASLGPPEPAPRVNNAKVRLYQPTSTGATDSVPIRQQDLDDLPRFRRSLSQGVRTRVKRGLFDGASKKDRRHDTNEITDEDDEKWREDAERIRRKKLARKQEGREKQRDDQASNHDGVLSGVLSSLVSKVAGVIGYLGKLTNFHRSS